MNTATTQRNHVIDICKSKNDLAHQQAKKIADPWFKTQALSWVARFNKSKTIQIAKEAEKSAEQCKDHYQKSAVLSWVIAALGEQEFKSEAKKLLNKAINLSREATPLSSRAEALITLYQASFKIDKQSTLKVKDEIETGCNPDEHWRCKRAIKNANKIHEGTFSPREFFW